MCPRMCPLSAIHHVADAGHRRAEGAQTAGPGAFDTGRRGGGRGGGRGRGGRGPRAPIQLPDNIKAGAEVEGPIVTTTAYGCFVAIAEGVRGMLRLAETNLPKGTEADSANGNEFFKSGEMIKVCACHGQPWMTLACPT